MSTTVRHRNRTGLRVAHATTSSDGHRTVLFLVCPCPQTVVAGTTWSWDDALGWHDPAEHEDWTPTGRPVRLPASDRSLALLGIDPVDTRTSGGPAWDDEALEDQEATVSQDQQRPFAPFPDQDWTAAQITEYEVAREVLGRQMGQALAAADAASDPAERDRHEALATDFVRRQQRLRVGTPETAQIVAEAKTAHAASLAKA